MRKGRKERKGEYQPPHMGMRMREESGKPFPLPPPHPSKFDPLFRGQKAMIHHVLTFGAIFSRFLTLFFNNYFRILHYSDIPWNAISQTSMGSCVTTNRNVLVPSPHRWRRYFSSSLFLQPLSSKENKNSRPHRKFPYLLPSQSESGERSICFPVVPASRRYLPKLWMLNVFVLPEIKICPLPPFHPSFSLTDDVQGGRRRGKLFLFVSMHFKIYSPLPYISSRHLKISFRVLFDFLPLHSV